LPTGQAILAIGYEDSAGSVGWQLDRLTAELGRADFAVVEDGEAAQLWKALNGFQAERAGPVSFVANLRPSMVPSFAGRLDSERWSVQAHAGNGIVRAHALGDWSLETLGPVIDQLRRVATQEAGNLILSQCPTDWKDRLRVWGEPRADWAIGERVRAALDHHAALNPGRFVGA
jgi:glycolate oxidase FAD binding subunit